MWKKSLFLFLTMAFVLASCSPKTDNADDNGGGNDTKKTTLTYTDVEYSLSANNGVMSRAKWGDQVINDLTSEQEYYDFVKANKDLSDLSGSLMFEKRKITVTPSGSITVARPGITLYKENFDLVVVNHSSELKVGDVVNAEVVYRSAVYPNDVLHTTSFKITIVE